MHEDNRIKLMGIVDDMSLKVVDGDVKVYKCERTNLRNAKLQMFCLGKLYAQEATYEDMKVDKLDGNNLRIFIL